jgi:hypothetical protein
MSRATNQLIGAGISQGLQNFASGYAERTQKKSEAEEKQRAAETYLDPNASPIQRAQASAVLGEKAITQLAKQSQTQQMLQDIQQRYGMQQTQSGMEQPPQPNELPQRVPNANEMQQQIAPQGNVQGGQFGEMPQISPGEILETTAVNPQVGHALADVAKMQQKEKLENRKEEREIRKETQPFVDEIIGNQKAAAEENFVLDQMDALSKSGQLTTPLTATLLQKAGFPLGVLDNPESEAFDKLSNQLTRTIQNYYGSRILQSEFHNFLRQIPTLQNSEEGRKRIIDNMRKAQIPKQLEFQAYKQVMQENGGKRPVDLKERVAEKLIPELNIWLKDMRATLDKTLPHQIPEGTIVIISPDGRRVAVPKDRVGEALTQGGQLE